jgi:signal transduction histidine kinase
MNAVRGSDRAWWIAVLGISGLVAAVVVIGLIGIVVNENIHRTVERAITTDVELEDRGDDLRVAILEVRHYHRDLLLNNADPTRISLWQRQYVVMTEEIAAVDEVLARAPVDDLRADLDELRRLATDYYDAFAAAVQSGIGSQEEFRVVAEDLLVPLDGMERIAQRLDQQGEERAAASFVAIDDASSTGTLILAGVILGLAAMGAVLAYLVLRLIRDQRRAVMAEQAAAAQMAELARTKSEFIADASHELRTPLTVLRGNAEIGLSMGSQGDSQAIFGEILDEATRMSGLVDDLLFLARSDSSSLPLDVRDVDILTASREVAARAEVLARDRGATLRAELGAEGTARVDATRIDQAVLILVDNAAKYGPARGEIELVTRIAADRLVIEVLDRGPGISDADRAQIFDRFYRVESTDRDRVRGAGLGLPIAAAIVSGHGGGIEAVPRDGGGTVMRISLPLRGPAQDEDILTRGSSSSHRPRRS